MPMPLQQQKKHVEALLEILEKNTQTSPLNQLARLYTNLSWWTRLTLASTVILVSTCAALLIGFSYLLSLCVISLYFTATYVLNKHHHTQTVALVSIHTLQLHMETLTEKLSTLQEQQHDAHERLDADIAEFEQHNKTLASTLDSLTSHDIQPLILSLEQTIQTLQVQAAHHQPNLIQITDITQELNTFMQNLKSQQRTSETTHQTDLVESDASLKRAHLAMRNFDTAQQPTSSLTSSWVSSLSFLF
jgi:peptidoglycan hydrolase CwlO-like protein